jgi:hypothetical protein
MRAAIIFESIRPDNIFRVTNTSERPRVVARNSTAGYRGQTLDETMLKKSVPEY